MTRSVFGIRGSVFLIHCAAMMLPLYATVLSSDLTGVLQAAWLVAVLPLAALVVVDLHAHRLPNVLTAITPLPFIFLYAADAIATSDARRYLVGGFAAVGLALFYVLLNVWSRNAIGIGDAKLALSVGLATGYLDTTLPLFATAISFILSATVSLALLAARRVRLTSDIPLGPFMVIGMLTVLHI